MLFTPLCQSLMINTPCSISPGFLIIFNIQHSNSTVSLEHHSINIDRIKHIHIKGPFSPYPSQHTIRSESFYFNKLISLIFYYQLYSVDP